MTVQDANPSRLRSRWTIALTAVAFFMVVLDALAVVTALPVIHRDLGASLAILQWTINAYTLAWAATIATAAALADRCGRRRSACLNYSPQPFLRNVAAR